jgi:hypothetical protein
MTALPSLPATPLQLWAALAALALVAALIAWPWVSPWLGEKIDWLLFGDDPDFDDDQRGGL